MKYTKDNPIRVATLCSGYDSQCLALNALRKVYPDFDYKLVAWAEFDPESKAPIEKQAAVVAHNALFPDMADRNLGDITKVDWHSVPDFELLFSSTPCTDISAAGQQQGFDKGSGTRSSIIWSVLDAVQTKRPKFIVMENVKNMVSKKFYCAFDAWQYELEKLGYYCTSQVLDAQDFGVPQHRQRVFLVAIRIDDKNNKPRYFFPQPFPLKKRLADVLADVVSDTFFLSDEMLVKFCVRAADYMGDEE